MRAGRFSLLVMLLLAVQGCSGPADQRALSQSFLTGGAELAAPVAMGEYTMPGVVAEPRHSFSGSLRLPDPGQTGGFEILHDPHGLVDLVGEPIRHLPEFDFEFVQRGNDIVPLLRGVIRRDHPYWEIILQPGRAWNEEGDADWTRASLPFALQEHGANCTHNGVLTWLFNNTSGVSRVAYQVSSETCGYFKFDMWGVAEAVYQPRDLGNSAASHIRRLDAHRQSRLPVRPLAELAKAHPGTKPLRLGLDDGIEPGDLTVLGLVVDGINYRGDCQTRHGPHPYCASLPLPSYSTAKSIFAAIATMRLEKLFPGSSQSSVAALIEECDPEQWRDVTIEHALDMATGNYRSAAFDADEASAAHIDFLYADTHEEKLDFSCNHFPRAARPGSKFVYHTSDTYLVGVALEELLRQKEGRSDLYEAVLVESIWQPLNLSPLLDDSKRTYDPAAQAYAGYGLTYEVDDVIRIASWLNDDRGRLDGKAMLDDALLDDALQRSPDDRGLEVGLGDIRYNKGFWAFKAGPSIGCAEPVWVPYMVGYGGISVVMFPNGVIYYYFSDSYVFEWQSARVAANAIKSLCP